MMHHHSSRAAAKNTKKRMMSHMSGDATQGRTFETTCGVGGLNREQTTDSTG